MGNEANLSDIQTALREAVKTMNETAAYDVPVQTGLKETLSLKKADKLRAMAKVFKIKKYSTLKKAELVDELAAKLTTPKIAAAILTEADGDEFGVFADAVKTGKIVFSAAENVPFHALQAFGVACAFMESENITLVIPDEIIETWKEIEKLGFLSGRQSGDIIHGYAMAAVNLYGAIKLSSLLDIVERFEDKRPEVNEAKSGLLAHISREKPYYLWNEYVVNKVFADDTDGLEELLRAGADIVRYVPQKDELLKYSSETFFEENLQNKNLVSFLEAAAGDGHLAKLLAGDVRCLMASGGTDDDCVMLLKACGLKFNDDNSPAWKLTLLLQNTRTVTRMWKYRGHTQYEMNSIKKPERNEKCPCGSDKKYKKCCWGK